MIWGLASCQWRSAGGPSRLTFRVVLEHVQDAVRVKDEGEQLLLVGQKLSYHHLHRGSALAEELHSIRIGLGRRKSMNKYLNE